MYQNTYFPWLSKLSTHFRILAKAGAGLICCGALVVSPMAMKDEGFFSGVGVLLGGAALAYGWFAWHMLLAEAIGLALRIEANTKTMARNSQELLRPMTDLPGRRRDHRNEEDATSHEEAA